MSLLAGVGKDKPLNWIEEGLVGSISWGEEGLVSFINWGQGRIRRHFAMSKFESEQLFAVFIV